jgi:hypothetical protein
MVLNGPEAISSYQNQVEVIDAAGHVVASLSGAKEQVAREIFSVVEERLVS